MSKSLRIIFAGTPDFAAKHLAKLLSSKHQIIGVFTQPDRPAGRGNKLHASPVKLLAEQYNIPVFQPISLKPEQNQSLISELQADIMVVVAYGLILPKAVLDMPRLGCVNVHGSLLPKWRGAAPIQRALWAGDQQTGITIMQMDVGLDTGDMLHKVTCAILPTDTSATLYDKLADLGPNTLLTTLEQFSLGQLVAEPQDNDLATYADKLSKEEAKLDWNLSAAQLERCVRAFNPWPISYFYIEDQPIKVWCAEAIAQCVTVSPGTIIQADKQGIQIATSDGILNITQLQPAGKKPMAVQDILNSRKEWFIAGTKLV